MTLNIQRPDLERNASLPPKAEHPPHDTGHDRASKTTRVKHGAGHVRSLAELVAAGEGHCIGDCEDERDHCGVSVGCLKGRESCCAVVAEARQESEGP